ncbi:MAG TPA: carboxypeptidase-like regulatory domain-containing protein, partial [Flavobacterium sp.]
MKNLQVLLTVLFIALFLSSSAQDAPSSRKIKLTGKVVEKNSQQPLEYATVTLFTPGGTKVVTGGVTNTKGEFDMDVNPGTYDIKVEFISFKPTDIPQKSLTENTNLGTVTLSEEITALDEVVVRAEKTTVEIKLDKKVYNVGNDLMVKVGTVSDV